jgi:glycerophosphoryl diester phosphodiesterase
MKKPVIFAHRGASAYAPENTMAAFKKAIELGSGGIELDVHRTKDGQIVVIHDEAIDRTSDGRGKVKEMTLPELLRFDFGSWFSDDYVGERIPTLEQVMEYLHDFDGILNIEIKEAATGIESAVVALINKYGMRDKVIISSFDHYILFGFKEFDDGIKTGALFMENLYEPWNYVKRFGASAIHPFYRSVNPEIIKQCRTNGIDVNVFTVDRADDIKMFAEVGASGIITNVPDVAIKILERDLSPR